MKRTAYRTIVGIAILVVILSVSAASISASPPPPNLIVDVTAHMTSPSAGFDSILYVLVPHQMPFFPPNFNLKQSFIVEEIDETDTSPSGIVSKNVLITCTLSTSPAYPNRNTVVTCFGTFPWRVNTRAYPGSTTGIYLIGFGLGETGLWRFTFTVTGLYDGAITTLSASFNVNVDPPGSTGPVQPE